MRPDGRARARALAERQVLNWAAAKARRQAEAEGRATGQLTRLVDDVAARRLSPPAAAERLLRTILAAPEGWAAHPDTRDVCATSPGPAPGQTQRPAPATAPGPTEAR